MIAIRLFLGFSTLVWLPYGVFCFFQPSFLGEAAGLAGHAATATTEIRAMYGGLEAGIGALCLSALFRPSRVRPALLMLGFLCGGLALTRTAGLFLDGSASAYTFGALAFEIPSAVIAILLARKGQNKRGLR
jgi:hypothetical protein